MSDFVVINSSSTSQPENVSGSLMGGEPLKLILLSAMFSLSILVRIPVNLFLGVRLIQEAIHWTKIP